MIKKASAGYNFNTVQDIKSHASILFNERMAILFYLLDVKSISLNAYQKLDDLFFVRAVIKQIYKNIRTLIRNNPTMRSTLNLETKDKGTYITDLGIGLIDQMIQYCEEKGFSQRKIYIIIQELNKLEMVIKDVLQYYHYFIRPDFRQKPDIEMATERYKEIADEKTIDELREIAGKRHKIDFEGLGSRRIDMIKEVEYDETVDGPDDEYDDLETQPDTNEEDSDEEEY